MRNPVSILDWRFAVPANSVTMYLNCVLYFSTDICKIVKQWLSAEFNECRHIQMGFYCFVEIKCHVVHWKINLLQHQNNNEKMSTFLLSSINVSLHFFHGRHYDWHIWKWFAQDRTPKYFLMCATMATSFSKEVLPKLFTFSIMHMNWKMEQKMEKLYQPHINLMICFPRDTLSDSFIFAGKVQQWL